LMFLSGKMARREVHKNCQSGIPADF